MKRTTQAVKFCVILLVLTASTMSFYAFTLNNLNDELFKQLGIPRTEANEKITRSILGGYLDAGGVRNIKNIALGNRAAVTRDLLTYTKQYVGSEAFTREYKNLKASNKPQFNTIQTPEELRNDIIAQYRKSVAEMELTVKKADASMKPVFEKVLEEGRKQLKDAEDPGNKMIQTYTKNYPELVETTKKGNEEQLRRWEEKYPANPLQYVKLQLIRFMNETSDVDFAATTISKNGKQLFENKAYESKSRYWKMAYRSGKEVVIPARAFVEEWIKEIN